MIITRTPFRISLFGGGTDYPQWYLNHGGAVLGTAINKYCYISIRNLPPFFEHHHRIVYSRVELVKNNDEIEHPAVRAVFNEFSQRVGIELHHDGDLPGRSGLGSSSSFTTGLVTAIMAQNGFITSPKALAKKVIHIEQDVIGENVGSQDQVWAAYGGTNLITFNTDGSFDVRQILMRSEYKRELQSHMMLVFTGITRIASNIAADVINSLADREIQLKEMREMANEGARLLSDKRCSIADLGSLINEGWLRKRSLASGVTNTKIDEIYDAAISAGAFGGKLLGAGGGGFMLFIAPPEAQPKIRERLKDLILVDIEIGASGSQVVVFEPDGLEKEQSNNGIGPVPSR
jgi:D-glycero-alpha-D-manno-heptose-7-phosphate kinase